MQSILPGDIQTLMFISSDQTVLATTNLTINNKLFAPIPTGGKYSIKLP